MTSTDDNTRTIEEAYQSAMSSSNLRVEADRRGDGDLLIAAGWSSMRRGHLFMRLRTQWDQAEKPRRLPVQPEKHFLALLGDPAKAKAAAGNAADDARGWYEQAMSDLLGKLTALPMSRTQATIQAVQWKWPDADARAMAVLRWWIDQQCHACGGTKWETVPGTNRHGMKVCRVCRGTGLQSVPHGAEGKRMANWLDTCVEAHRGAIRRNLSAHREARGCPRALPDPGAAGIAKG